MYSLGTFMKITVIYGAVEVRTLTEQMEEEIATQLNRNYIVKKM